MDNLIDNLSAIVGRENVLSRPDELLVYECDGLPQHKHRPRAVVFPSSTEETAAIMRELARANVPFTPRGAGTGLSGGALALNSGVVIELARMRKILSIDPDNRLAVVQPGVVNLQRLESSCSLWPVLRSRSFQPADLHNRWQHRRECGWHSLPEVWNDD